VAIYITCIFDSVVQYPALLSKLRNRRTMIDMGWVLSRRPVGACESDDIAVVYFAVAVLVQPQPVNLDGSQRPHAAPIAAHFGSRRFRSSTSQ
jgi:hypothetical protein